MRTPLALYALLAALTAGSSTRPARAEELRVDAAHSVFAVVTRKAGVAAAFAHDHLITAPRATVQLAFDAADPGATRATWSSSVESLEFDPPGPRARLEARLHEIGIGPADLPSVSATDRKKVREAALGKSQLDAAGFPELKAELLGLEPATKASGAFTWTAKLRFTVRGKSVEHPLTARFEDKGGKLTAEAYGDFLFSEFGIEPYSAALGAIRNEDRFFVYVALVAAP
jgi:polyisoprenoid-binding protein YceI